MSTDLAVSSRPAEARCPEMFYDKIVLWRDVQSGDLVILDDALVVAVQVDVIQKPWGDGTTFPAVDVRHQLDNGHFVVSERHGNRLTAVRRPKGEL